MISSAPPQPALAGAYLHVTGALWQERAEGRRGVGTALGRTGGQVVGHARRVASLTFARTSPGDPGLSPSPEELATHTASGRA